ncbi:MAG TPA: PaaI family thioesterase [Acidimicrobiales bacterium]|nr:PaaI family thioesterase [Acidimicrobiales bacterium]
MSVLPMTVDELQAFLDGAFPNAPPPYVVEEVAGNSIRMRQTIGPRDSRPGGTVSGPSLMALADCASYLVIIGQIGPVALAVTTSLHIDFLRKPELVDVVAEGTLLKLGRQLAVADVALFSAGNDALVAKAQVTYSIPPDRGRK